MVLIIVLSVPVVVSASDSPAVDGGLTFSQNMTVVCGVMAVSALIPAKKKFL